MELRLNREGTIYVVGLPDEKGFFTQLLSLTSGEGPSGFGSLTEALEAKEKWSKELNKALAVYKVSIEGVPL